MALEQVRQGDILFIPVGLNRKFSGITAPRDDKGRILVALGEATGHAHAIHEEDAEMVSQGRVSYINTGPSGATVVHEEHNEVKLDPNAVYEVRNQRTHNPRSARDTIERRNYD